MGRLITKVVEKDGLKFLDIQEDYTYYHEGNGGRASEAVKNFVATHDDRNSYGFTDDDINDLLGYSLETNYGYMIPADIIIKAIYAGMCAAEWADKPEAGSN